MDSPPESASGGSSDPDSSLLSSPPPSPTLSDSDLSSLGRTPSPPPELVRPLKRTLSTSYPSPPASQQTSPPPDGMESTSTTDKEGPPPAKRRRISKERSTEYLDLRSDRVDSDHQAELDQLLQVLHKRRKIVVIAGAGISVSAGIPDFRSANGLFKSLKDEHKLKGSGKDLFDASVYKDDTATSSFHDMVSSMSRMTKDAKPTPFHHMLATIASEGRLLRLYSQNVDGIDTSIPPLSTTVPLRKDATGKWPRTVQLHGGLDKMVCSKCHELSDLDADLFSGPVPPACPNCVEFNSIRVNHEGKRSHGIGRLRPRMVLYNEANPDDTAIGSVTADDLRKRPDAVIVAGTTLKVPGVKRIVREMCKTVRDRRGGVAIWINVDLPPVVKELEDCFDIIVQGTCDEVATRAAMRQWHELPEQDTYSEVSDMDAQRAIARTAEVHVPKCTFMHAPMVELSSERHLNNSFGPPPEAATPKKPFDAPTDWSPMTSRRASITVSIESETGMATVGASGLLTPTKPATAGLVPKAPSLNDKLKDAGATKKPAGRPPKGAASLKLPKPQTKAAKQTKPRAKPGPKAKAGPLANNLTSTFKQSKAASVTGPVAKKPTNFTPAPSPSKLRQVTTMSSDQPMHRLSPQDPRNNTSPSKMKPYFPGLKSENASGEKLVKRMSILDMVN